ncbi:g-patch domain protein [Necator americanus]|uniref:G-patch domain protein n=1 Tax=Necator americanus TaxID=51031 RepID=W2T9E6_NECAM|nr:g-patch domain protein [Necator americanus]ETN77612.1 g-patch domain protein [Necator americanus]
MNKKLNRDLLDRAISRKQRDEGTELNSVGGNDALNRKDLFYCTVRNIPSHLKSKDLRRYFADYVETGKFHCFHYRHRPECQQEVFFCRSEFIRHYHGQHWINNEGMEIPRRCFVSAAKVAKSSEDSSDYINDADLRQMIELRPPSLMPRGNVGTPSEYFLEQIRLCRLPPSLIPKLGIEVTRRRRKYDSVPFHYSSERSGGSEQEATDIVEHPSGARDLLGRNIKRKELADEEQSIRDQVFFSKYLASFLSTVEQALYDDVTEQDRTKPRKYEEEMEIVWEKGGPGLVWYTDKNYWDKREKGSDCDWAWADDWDVDYSVYYEGKSTGTRDARDAVEMREDEERRTGKLIESVFTKKSKAPRASRKRRNSDSDVINIEQYSKGIGSKLLGIMGWKPGSGLGRLQQGRVHPVAIQLEEDSQSGFEKKGFGYHGERMQRTGFMTVKKPHSIASRFDAITDAVPTPHKRLGNVATGDVLFRRAEPTIMKYRPIVKEVNK